MVKKFLSLIILFSFKSTNYLFADNIKEDPILFYNLYEISNCDSIENIWVNKKQEDLEKLKWLLSLEKYYYLESSPKKGSLIKKIEQIYGLLKTENGKGNLYFFKGGKEQDQAKDFEANISYKYAVAYFKNSLDSIGMANAYISLGTLKKYDDAKLINNNNLYYLKSASEIVNKLNYLRLYIRLQQAYISYYFTQTPQNKTAINEIVKNIEEKIKGHPDENWARIQIHQNLGLLAFSNNNFEEAISNWEKTMKLYVNSNNKFGEASVAYNLGLANYYIYKFKKSIDLTNLALCKFKNLSNIEQLKNCYQLIQLNLRELNLKNEALLYGDSLSLIQDSLLTIQRSSDAKKQAIYQNLINTKFENLRLESNQTISNLQKKLLVTINIALLIFLFLCLYFYRKTKKINNKLTLSNLKLENLNESKDLVMSIFAHDIKRPIISLLGLGKTIGYLIKTNQFDKINTIAYSLETSTLKTTNLIENLMSWANNKSTSIFKNEEKINLYSELNIISKLYNLPHLKISFIINCPENIEIKFDQNDFHVVMRNLIDNSINNTPPNDLVKIKFSANKNTQNQVELIFENNGYVLTDKNKSQIIRIFDNPENFIPKTNGIGFGLILIGRHLKLNQAKISLLDLKIGVGYSILFSE